MQLMWETYKGSLNISIKINWKEDHQKEEKIRKENREEERSRVKSEVENKECIVMKTYHQRQIDHKK